MMDDWLQDLKNIEEICDGNVDLFITESARARHVRKYYDGDLKRYGSGTDRFDRDAVKWEIIQAYSDYHPEHQKFVEKLISWRLGFMPSENIIISTSVHMRQLIEDFGNSDSMTFDEYKNLMDQHLKHIRNEYIQLNGWLDHLDLDRPDFKHYETYEPQLKTEARRLISEFLGYEPELKYSLYAEVTFRSHLASMSWAETDSFTQCDIRCQFTTIVKYLEVLHTQGRAAADQSPLCGFDWENDFKPDILN